MCKTVKNVYADENCCSCSICTAICPTDAITLLRDKKGFLKPMVNEKQCIGCEKCYRICPGQTRYVKKYENIVKGQAPKVQSIMPVAEKEEYFLGFSLNDVVRLNSASGGMTTAILLYLIEKGIFDYCSIVPTVEKRDIVKAKLTNDCDEIINASASKYCPVDFTDVILEAKQLLINGKKIVLVLLPCQIQAVKMYLKKWSNQLLFIALMCNHIPSYKATDYFLYVHSIDKIKSVRYRGGIWPGYMSIESDAATMSFPFIEEWNKGFGYLFYNKRCKSCNDPFGIFADICVGDPYFIEREQVGDGMTFAIVRSNYVINLMEDMLADKYLYYYKVDESFYTHERLSLITHLTLPTT